MEIKAPAPMCNHEPNLQPGCVTLGASHALSWGPSFSVPAKGDSHSAVSPVSGGPGKRRDLGRAMQGARTDQEQLHEAWHPGATSCDVLVLDACRMLPTRHCSLGCSNCASPHHGTCTCSWQWAARQPCTEPSSPRHQCPPAPQHKLGSLSVLSLQGLQRLPGISTPSCCVGPGLPDSFLCACEFPVDLCSGASAHS